jgi:hypothetical protein
MRSITSEGNYKTIGTILASACNSSNVSSIVCSRSSGGSGSFMFAGGGNPRDSLNFLERSRGLMGPPGEQGLGGCSARS